jgi:GTP-binding protein Era
LKQYCGYIALLGQPNAGKSTLMNACVGQKIAGVSRKPQTTRNKIVGILTDGMRQSIFVDTPGIHDSARKPKINEMMNDQAWSAIKDVDVVCYLVDAVKGWDGRDSDFFSQVLLKTEGPLFVLCTKSNRFKKDEAKKSFESIKNCVEGLVKECKKELHYKPELVLLSSKNPLDVQAIRARLSEKLPENPWLFAKDDLTNRPQTFIVSEMIREQIFRLLSQEIPYQTGVIVDKISFEETPKPKVLIFASIIVSKQAHKKIVIGSQGATIAEIGKKSRATLGKHFGKKVFLELFVKVDQNWFENLKLIQEYQSV